MLNHAEAEQPLNLREQFLERFSRELARGCTPLERFETISELRAHLAASAAAYEELGLEPAEAMAAAIKSFGDAKVIAKKIRRESSVPGPARLHLIACVGTGTIAAIPLMILADWAFVAVGLVANRSEGMAIVGAIVGWSIGLCLHCRPRTPMQAALRFGLIVPTVLQVLICLLNRAFPAAPLMAFTFVVFGATGACSGAITAWVSAIVRRANPPLNA